MAHSPSWRDLAAGQPALAAALRQLLHQYGPGLGYLATVRADGGPRVHPVAPIVTSDALYCFVIASPKRNDLDRDGRYALHTFPAELSDAEGYLSGSAEPVRRPSTLRRLARLHRASATSDWTLYELSVEVAMLHRVQPGQPAWIWRAPTGYARYAFQASSIREACPDVNSYMQASSV